MSGQGQAVSNILLSFKNFRDAGPQRSPWKSSNQGPRRDFESGTNLWGPVGSCVEGAVAQGSP